MPASRAPTAAPGSRPMASCTMPCWRYSVEDREDLDAAFGDDDRVLELRGGAAVERDDRPAVVPLHDVGLAEREHRLAREHHPDLQAGAVARLVVRVHVR